MLHSHARTPLLRWLALLFALVLTIGSFPHLQAQTAVRYFPETGHYLGGAFRVFWEGNGGLEIFGFPVTEEFTPAGGRLSQYFERARFELTERNGQAVVELGKLGVEFTGGRVFPKVPPIENTAQRRYIPQTQHIIQYGFKEIWETRGAERIFGLPISEEIEEVLEDGEWHTIQYFERVRFEYWPNFPAGQRVLISNLGRRLAPPELTPPLPPNAPPGTRPGTPAPPSQPAPAPAPPPLPASVNARVVPDSGPPGTSFRFEASGFDPGENVGIWLTAPDQATVGADFQATADDQGSIAGANIGIRTDDSFPEGIWSFNAQGVSSKKQSIGYFRISRVAAAQGDPNKLGVILHDQLPTRGNVLILPIGAPAGTPFVFLAGDFTPGETVGAWVTGSDGKTTPIDPAAVELDASGTVAVSIDTAGFAEGVYNAVAEGASSKTLGSAGFKLTRDYVAGPGTPRPASVNGGVAPAEGGAGTTFQLRGQGLSPGEPLELWLTDPNGLYVLFPGTVPADGQGRIGYDPALDLEAPPDAALGVYGIHFRGKTSGARVDFYFTLTGNARSTPVPGSGLRLLRQLANKGVIPAVPMQIP